MAFLSGFVGFTLVLAGTTKFWQNADTERFLLSLGITPSFAAVAAATAASIEVVIGAVVISGVLLIVAAPAAGGLAALFVVLQVAAYRQSPLVATCNCFGSITTIESKGTELVRTAVFATATAVLTVLAVSSNDGLLRPSVDLDATAAGGAVAGAFLLGSSLVAAIRWTRGNKNLERSTNPGEVQLA